VLNEINLRNRRIKGCYFSISVYKTIVFRPGPVQGPGSGFCQGHQVLTGSSGRLGQFSFFKKMKTTSF
jgi:hypothetical protein